MLMVIGHVAASATESHGFTQLSLGHVRLFGSQVDGWMPLDERHPTMWLRHAADGLPRQQRYIKRDLTLFVWDWSQILLSYSRAGPWTRPRPGDSVPTPRAHPAPRDLLPSDPSNTIRFTTKICVTA